VRVANMADMTLTWDSHVLPALPRHVPVRRVGAPPVCNPPWVHDSKTGVGVPGVLVERIPLL
jgi:hypothetical protein